MKTSCILLFIKVKSFQNVKNRIFQQTLCKTPAVTHMNTVFEEIRKKRLKNLQKLLINDVIRTHYVIKLTRFSNHFEKHATMLQSNDSSISDPIVESDPGVDSPRDALTEILRSEVPSSCRVPGQRSRRTARVLRLSSGELVPPPNDESDRKHVRHDPAPPPKDPRLRFGKSVSDDDVQARSECVQRLEKTPRTHPPQRPSPRSSFHRRTKRAHTQRKEKATFLRKQSIQRNRRLNQQTLKPNN